jgi:lysophospholipase L1-like esterase
MKKLVLFSIVLNLVLAPIALLYFIRKVQFYKEMRRDAASLVFRKKMRTPYWEQRKTLFDVLPAPQNPIVFLGNSIIANCEWSELLNNKNIVNRGIGGDNLDGIISRIDQIIKMKPQKVFILASTNDLPGNFTNIDTIANKYSRLIAKIMSKLPDSKIFVYSELPRDDNAGAANLIAPLNAKIRQMAMRDKITYIDIYKYFANQDGTINHQYTNDGLHLKGQGYNLWKNIVQQYVN